MYEGTEVDKLNFRGHTLVSIQSQDHRSFTADQFLFATGAEAGRLGGELGCRLPIIPGKGFSVTIETAGDTDADAMRVPMIFEDDHVAVTPDGVPCIGSVPRAGNAWIAAGNGMVGMATGSGTGKLVSEMILELHPHLDPTPFRPDRLSQRRKPKTSSVHTPISPQSLARDV